MLTMFVALYTSRIVLDVLGASDYGLYNVVGGVVAMMTFVTFTYGMFLISGDKKMMSLKKVVISRHILPQVIQKDEVYVVQTHVDHESPQRKAQVLRHPL